MGLLFRVRVFLLFIVCFSFSLLYGADEKDYRNLRPSVGIVQSIKGYGTGFFITENLFVTAYHNIQASDNASNERLGRDPLRVYTLGKKDYGRVLVVDPQNDLAIIKMQRNDYKPLSIGSDTDIIRGKETFTIGYPPDIALINRGENEAVIRAVVAQGFIGMKMGNEIFGITAFASKGSSGSPVFSEDLKVVGVVVLITPKSISGYQTFVTPIHKLKTLIDRNKDLLEREGGMGFGHISSEPLKRRAFDADVKTAEDMFILGLIYKEGLRHRRPNFQKAHYWHERAAKSGYRDAAFSVAQMYYTGKGVKKDFQKAFYWFQVAATHGHRESQFHVALMHYRGEGTAQNFSKAFEGFKSLAEQRKYRGASAQVALMYYAGKGVKKDFQKAFYWFQVAATHGHRDSQYNVALMHYRGEGTAQNFSKAFEGFKSLAEKGHKIAQHDLSVMYARGEGVLKNLKKATYWWKKSKGEEGSQCFY